MKSIRHLLFLVLAVFLFVPFSANAQQSKEVMLAGYKLHPKVGTTGSGFFTLELNGDTLQVHGDFSNLMSSYTGAYIMAGKIGSNANALYSLEVTTNDQQTSGKLKASDNTFVLNEAQKDLLKEGNLYFLVSSSEHQNGELAAPIPPMGN